MITPVILTGGSGSRLWPLSRAGYPKQFLSLAGERTMFQETLLRVQGDQFGAPLVVCNEEHRFVVAEQLRALGVEAERILLEPVGRNTAPAVAVAALSLMEHDPDARMLVMPSDHVVFDTDAFVEGVEHAAAAADAGYLATFGIQPNKPETGYGYIEKASEPVMPGVHRVSQFVEKPDQKTAKAYVDSGDYLWNSGMFLFRAEDYVVELQAHHPDMLKACEDAIAQGEDDMNFRRLNREAFFSTLSESIDYAVMEKTERAAVVPVEMGWNDVGSWSSLWEIKEKDESNNAVSGDVVLHETSNSYVHSQKGLVAVSGLDNVVVVATDDAILVADRRKAQDVKKLVETLKKQGREEHYQHAEVHRPWGAYCGIDLGERYQVKHITVKPGERLSLQMHYHRAEHWIVVSGTALVTHGERTFLLHENESTYIPCGETHRLENPGMVPLHLIEVQSGSYLGEDDIVRFEDGYGRAEQCA
ncbi:mannose-1-phosphate guanylyltransferase/mannose-6-phosphate isomerase [Guyparkeria sp. SCN-R1]|uniref:mannose-1-phosphate guanylyltransferase/mannose-6-phosphate isomerase n=1 Tax=unclassified Guyparkeria TaxID=2626246 RepID=UPI000F647940|nr:mannose-1-phosphate guanylyltransferase/mannose-6-phosphate isomerase [Guyparkeria sp. SCN-R1]RRQ19898.1 mannose-1-phosphate guanylyltransferase/mannose-6-phosphate isomerase [Guyparkeria sp. SCN-R1]